MCTGPGNSSEKQRFPFPERGRNAIPEVGKPAPVNRLFQTLSGTISATGAGTFITPKLLSTPSVETGNAARCRITESKARPGITARHIQKDNRFHQAGTSRLQQTQPVDVLQAKRQQIHRYQAITSRHLIAQPDQPHKLHRQTVSRSSDRDVSQARPSGQNFSSGRATCISRCRTTVRCSSMPLNRIAR